MQLGAKATPKAAEWAAPIELVVRFAKRYKSVCQRPRVATSPASRRVVPPGPGRPPGPSKHTLILKDALLLAAQTAGGGGPAGLHNYLAKQAKANPSAFMAMLSKVLPLQPTGGDSGKVIVNIVKHFGDEEPVTLIEHGATGGEEG